MRNELGAVESWNAYYKAIKIERVTAYPYLKRENLFRKKSA